MPRVSQVQIGKQGVTDNFIETLRNHFKNSPTVKISVLKNSTRDRKEVKNMASKIVEKLGDNFNARVIGFTISVKKWRKSVRA